MTRHTRFPRSVEGNFLQVIKEVSGIVKMGHPAMIRTDRGKKPASKRENGFWITHAANISLIGSLCPLALDRWDSLLVSKGTAGNRSVEQSEC